MSVETITLLITDMQDRIQGIAYEIERINTLYADAITKQDNRSFERQLYTIELKNLETLIDIEERLYKHAEYLRITAGISSTPGGDFPGGVSDRREVRRGDR